MRRPRWSSSAALLRPPRRPPTPQKEVRATARRPCRRRSHARRGSSRIPVLALVVGLGAMTAVVALVVFFVMGGDVSTGRSASSVVAAPSAEVAPEAVAAPPAASFIVITAPDIPETKPKLPAWATARHAEGNREQERDAESVRRDERGRRRQHGSTAARRPEPPARRRPRCGDKPSSGPPRPKNPASWSVARARPSPAGISRRGIG